MKNRVDLLALPLYSDGKLLGVLARTVRESRVEYTYLDARYEREGRRLRETVDGLLLETRGRSGRK